MAVTKGQRAIAANVSGRPGVEKVVAVLLALDKATAIDLLKSMEPTEIDRVVAAAAAMNGFDTSLLRVISEEFETRFLEGVKFVGTVDEVEALVAHVQSSKPIAATPDTRSVWDDIAALPDEILVRYFSQQPVQLIAFAMLRLPEGRASDLVKGLDANIVGSVMVRMATIGSVSELVEKAVGDALREDLLQARRPSGAEQVRVARILNRLDGTRAATALETIEKSSPETARALQKYLFRFEQLLSLPQSSLALILDPVPVDVLVTALQGAPREFQAGLLAVLAPRARRLAESELQGRPPANPQEVAKARLAITESVLKMVAAGDLVLDARPPGAN